MSIIGLTFFPPFGVIRLFRHLLLFGAVLTLLPNLELQGQMSVSPPRILLEGRTRSAEIILTNGSNEMLEVTTEVGFSIGESDSLGKLGLRAAQNRVEESRRCDSLLRVFPSRFTIQPMESRTVRVLLSLPGRPEPGEYWARLRLTGTPTSFEDLDATDSLSGIRTRIRMAVRLDLPVVFRFGEVSTSIAIDDLRPRRDSAGNLSVAIRTVRGGNAAYRGTIFGALRTRSGDTIAYAHRQFTTEFEGWSLLSFGFVPTGEYSLDLRSEAIKIGSAMDVVLPSLPVEFSQEILVSETAATAIRR